MDTANDFWKEYCENDLTKEKKLKNVVIRIDEFRKIEDETVRKKLLSFALRSYFDDLIEYMEYGDEDDDMNDFEED